MMMSKEAPINPSSRGAKRCGDPEVIGFSNSLDCRASLSVTAGDLIQRFPNTAFHPAGYSGLRPLPSSAELRRYGVYVRPSLEF